MVLNAMVLAKNNTNRQTEDRVRADIIIHAKTVKKWRDRWRANEAKLVLIDIEEKGIN